MIQSEKEYKWRIVDICEEAPLITTLVLEALDECPSFKAGQYLTVKLPGHDPVEGKAYSISSPPQEKHVNLTIKKFGIFSESIISKKISDTLITSAPYGFFYPEKGDTSDLVLIAGGIGITPLISITEDILGGAGRRKVHLFYSNKTIAGSAFVDKLKMLKSVSKDLSVTHFITRENVEGGGYQKGRITAQKVLSLIPPEKQYGFFLCGSIPFTRDIWRDLQKNGVAPETIYTEAFY